MSGGWNLLNFFSPNNQTGAMGVQTPSTPLTGIDGAAQFIAPQRLRDVVGKLKVSQSQNIYDADFEYGVQPLRWENFIANVSGQASIVQNPGLGGVTMTIGGGNVPGDITVRQSRPYHRYQPGKTMYMASNVNFGTSLNGQFQRVGIFDDSNGIFFMQQGTPTPDNPYAMYCVIRSDSGGLPTDQVFPMGAWNGNQAIIKSLDWTKVQMIWMEYAWYGAGALRFGVVINGEPWVVHQVGTGNGTVNGVSQVKPWSRTGNLPARYEQRDNGSTGLSVMTHYGVSILIEGGIDRQRGFTYSYGNYAAQQSRTVPASAIRYPMMSFRMRTVGTDQFDNTNSAITAGTNTTLTIGNLGTVGGTTISSVVGQSNNGQALFTFGGAHGYAVTNPANANNASQYITLSSFTEVGTSASGGFSFSGTTLTVTTVTSGAFQANQTLSGTGIVGTPTIVNQLTSTGSAVGSQAYSSGGAAGSSVVTLAAGTSFAVGQLIAGTGIPAGSFITGVNGASITISQAFTAQVSGTVTSYAPGGVGTYTVSSAQTTFAATLTATTTYAAGTYLIQSVPTTTTMILPIQLLTGVTATTNPTATYWGVNQFVGKSIYYQAALPALSTAVPGSATVIGGITQFPVVLGFAAAHNLLTGNVITIANAGSTAYNGTYNVSVSTTTTGAIIYFANVTPGTFTAGSVTVSSPYTARITSNTVNVLTFQDIITGLPLMNSPTASGAYQIGLIDRGQLLPQTLLINTSATALVELIASTPTNQTSLQAANFKALNTLGSYNSFAEVDLSSTGVTGGEVVYSFSTPNNALQQIDLSSFFPVLTNIKGNVADILTVAVTTSTSTVTQVNVVCQEAMA